ncbi:MAG: DUF3617 family protein [Thermodesulfobacterium sp.]|nr:DUF3617 family protein [Thermodesulfobacterium sp.]
MNKKFLVLVLMFFCFFVTFNVMAEGLNMKEGLWQITVTMEIPGMSIQMPPHTFTHCLTKTDYIPLEEEPNKDCKIIKHDIVGDTVTWIVKCKTPEGSVISKGKVTYKGTTFDGVVKIEQEGMKITQKMKGKLIGKCK